MADPFDHFGRGSRAIRSKAKGSQDTKKVKILDLTNLLPPPKVPEEPTDPGLRKREQQAAVAAKDEKGNFYIMTDDDDRKP